MVSQLISSVENSFTKGLVTEFTGLNFPENAATDTDNCVYTIVGDVTRRLGFNKELNGIYSNITRNNAAINSYKWNNAGGDGSTQFVVTQVGTKLYFYKSSAATVLSPLSTKLYATVDITPFVTTGSTNQSSQECQFASGNGYLFVYHPSCNPFFCAITGSSITATVINVQIRDFVGVKDGLAVSDRPKTLSNEHLYNLVNQGWSAGSPWAATSAQTKTVFATGTLTYTDVQAGLAVTLGDYVNIYATGFGAGSFVGQSLMGGTVTAYAGTTMTINVVGSLQAATGQAFPNWSINPINHGYINTWNTAIGNYPSNADVWWYFKDSSNVFNPSTTVSQVTLNTGPGPSGHFVMSAFDLNRTLAASVSGLTEVITHARPRTGTWFQGRTWYTGIDDSQVASGDVDFYTWTENIYFSQIVTAPSNFGQCYQTNDPTSEKLFDLLPTDGGVITISGSGPIYKLFPIQNGMLVFAANGIWFITGSQGIGFTANDYTITHISAVQSISSTSFVDVQGLPYFWNEDGIYAVQPSKNGGLEVNPITVGTILQFYNTIPLGSKKYARAAYDPIEYVIQWVYRSTDDNGSVTARYEFDKILNLNTYNKAFYPYTIADGIPSVSGIVYVISPGGTSAPSSAIKFVVTSQDVINNFTFGEEYDDNYVDWGSTNFTSYFVTGYKLHGQGQKRMQIPYLYIFSRADTPTAYKIQGLWDYASSGLSGKWSSLQQIYNNKPYFGMIFRRHRIRGQGIVLQIKITSTDGLPFDIMGWSSFENVNAGV